MKRTVLLVTVISIAFALCACSFAPGLSNDTTEHKINRLPTGDDDQCLDFGWEIEDGTLTVSGEGAMLSDECTWRSEEVSRVVICEGITKICGRAFFDHSQLREAELPSTLTDIGEEAFGYCVSLEKIAIPDGVSIIPKEAFRNCTSLESVSLSASLETISQKAFYKCRSLQYVIFPGGLCSIEESAFEDCRAICGIDLPESVVKLGKKAFYNCFGLSSVNAGKNLSVIGMDAFKFTSSELVLYAPQGSVAYAYGEKNGITVSSGN